MASIRKRQWTKPDGTMGETWEVRYLDPTTGRSPAKSFKLKKEADAFRRKVEHELSEGIHIARRQTRTVAALIDEYMAHAHERARLGQISQAHAEACGRALRYARDDLGGVLLASLTWQQVETHGRSLRRRTSGVFDHPLAHGTINNSMALLSRAIGWGVRRGYAIRNVVPDAQKELGQLPERPIDTFNQHEMQRLISEVEVRAPKCEHRSVAWLRAMVYLGAMCGLRRGEIFALRWQDINFEAGLIAINHSLTNRDELKGPKTKAGRRTVPLPRLVADALRAWEPFTIEDDRRLIFRTKRGLRVCDKAFYRAHWHPLLVRAGFPPVQNRHRHFHALRHFAGSAWLDAGVPLPEVSRLLGHANVAITAKVYSHAITEIHHRASIMDQCAARIAQPQPDTQQLRIAA